MAIEHWWFYNQLLINLLKHEFYFSMWTETRVVRT